jgi:photosystem II stability/assembly factor-like uncharacterized protein
MKLSQLLRVTTIVLTVTFGYAQDKVANDMANVIPPTFYEGLEWRNIGPQRGGRSLGCAGSPSRPNEYYFGATGGGLWKTMDGGNEWKPVTDGQITSSSVGAVAVSETNPDIVYIGMGEVQLRGSITQGDGVYKSMDAGETWEHLGLEDTQAIARIRIHPTNPDVVYVAALGHPYGDNEERGVFKTLDGGKTWNKLLYVSPKAGAVDLIIDQNDPETLYASTWEVQRKAWKMWGGGGDSKLWKSTDGGKNWTDLTANQGMPAPPIGKIGVTVSPVDSNRVWAIVEANEGGVFRSDDGGKTWTKTNDERKLRQRAFYYSRIYADPKDKETVYCLNTGFYKSTDGGKTFDITINVPHGDNHDLWIDPNNPDRMINSNDGGGNVSINGGKSWTEQDYITTQLYHVMATSDVPYHVVGAQQDNSTVAVPSDGWDHRQARGPNHGWFYSVGGGESGWITQHPKNPDIFYAGSQGALLTRYDRSNGQIRDIQVYPRFFSGEPASALPERWQWTFPIMFAPQDANVMYTCSQHVWKTTDDGQSWEKISPDLTYADPTTLGKTGGVITMDMNGPEIYATVFALAPSFHDINTIWAGSDDGKIHITRDGGKNWQDITPEGLPKFSRVSIIEESTHRPGTLFVAANRYQVDDRAPYVFKTHDYGKTWTKIVEGIEDGHFARAVREDPEREGLLFLGTEHGVYFSINDGAQWESLQLELPDTPIRDLVVKDDDVVLGTHGRGFWILDDIHPLRQYKDEMKAQSGILFQPSNAIRGITEAKVQYYLAQQLDTITLEVLDAQGEVIDTFTGSKPKYEKDPDVPYWRRGGSTKPTTAKGLNTFTWDLRYPGATDFEGMIIWSARPTRGPKAPLGNYSIRMKTGDDVQEHAFSIEMDPNLKGITKTDLDAQFTLAKNIMEKTDLANRTVIKIRNVKDQLEKAKPNMGSSDWKRTFSPFLREISAVEEALYQVKNQSNQDPLNFPIKLNNRLASLRRSVETGDARPTNGAYKVFNELSQELENHLDQLDKVMDKHLPKINRILQKNGKTIIAVGD